MPEKDEEQTPRYMIDFLAQEATETEQVANERVGPTYRMLLAAHGLRSAAPTPARQVSTSKTPSTKERRPPEPVLPETTLEPKVPS